ncbi:unnamed protein product [Blepharisma stoltei]|uniref:Uncharacterized protein n=1 Tax=Blepharisma stoltei TaxID=1481888 RepID=A0AAU9K2N4_9CILI|nr:unnamed protein product [Blepharisma stoltei]
MLESLSGNLAIKDFLYLYPRSQWARCCELLMVIGISAIQNRYSGFVSVSELETISHGSPLPLAAQMPGIKAQLKGMIEEIDNYNNDPAEKEFKRSSSVNNLKNKRPPRSSVNKEIPGPILMESTPKFRCLDEVFSKPKGKDSSRSKENSNRSPLKTIKPSTMQQPKGTPHRKVPKYLQNVDSKIRCDVKKDIQKFFNPDKKLLSEFQWISDEEIQRNPSPTLESITSREDTNFPNKKPLFEDTFTYTETDENQSPGPKIKKKLPEQDFSSEVIQLADEFLNNPLISHLSRRESQKSSPIKPLKTEEIMPQIPFGDYSDSFDGTSKRIKTDRMPSRSYNPSLGNSLYKENYFNY